MKTRRVGSSQSCEATAEKWGHKVASCWHGKEKQVDRVRNRAGTASLSSSSSTLVAADVDTKELGLIESGSENAEKSWLGMVVDFVAINQFSRDSVTCVHVCPKSYTTHATLSLKVWDMREVVYNEMDLHGEVRTQRPMLSMIWWQIEGFHLTVGDRCRKLGGHGREMILRRETHSLLISSANVNEEHYLQVPARKFPDEEERRSICRHEHPVTGLFSVCRNDGEFYLVAESRLVQPDSCDRQACSECLFLFRNAGEFALPSRLESVYLGSLHWWFWEWTGSSLISWRVWVSARVVWGGEGRRRCPHTRFWRSRTGFPMIFLLSSCCCSSLRWKNGKRKTDRRKAEK